VRPAEISHRPNAYIVPCPIAARLFSFMSTRRPL
jgi:hypothetical protein